MENRRKPAPPVATLDINCDCKEYVLDYFAHSFPVQLYEPFTDSEGNLASRPAFDADGNPILNREACRARDAMLDRRLADFSDEEREDLEIDLSPRDYV